MWPNNRIFVDSNLAWTKTIGMNQLVTEDGGAVWTDQLFRHLHLYVSCARHTDRRGALPVCFYLSALLRQIPARVKSGGYRWVSSLRSVQCIAQRKRTSQSRRGKTINIIIIPKKSKYLAILSCHVRLSASNSVKTTLLTLIKLRMIELR